MSKKRYLQRLSSELEEDKTDTLSMVFTRSSSRLASKSSSSGTDDSGAAGSAPAKAASSPQVKKQKMSHLKKKSSQKSQPQAPVNNSVGRNWPALSQQVHHHTEKMHGRNPNSLINYPPSMSRNNYYMGQPCNMMHYADVRFRSLPFYELVEEIIKPTAINIDQCGMRMMSCLSFVLSPQNIQSIKMDQVLVLLRICLEETTCEQNDLFPNHCQVFVNESSVPMPVQPPSNKPVIERKSPSEPLNIKKYMYMSPFMKNSIKIYGEKDYQKYAACVVLVKKLSSMDLLRKLRNKGTKHADFTRSLIKEKLREDVDCEIATTSLRVSLNCPLGKMRMLYPCRASTCLHLQCFDASLFLQMNERKSTWVCPVCDKSALFDNLVIDGYFQEVLSSPVLAAGCSEIQLHKDGSWSAHSKREFDQVDVLPKPAPMEVINLDLDVIPICDSGNEESSSKSRSVIQQAAASSSTDAVAQPQSHPPPKPAAQANVVDLTSDSEDDLPLKKRFCKTYNSEINEVDCNSFGVETVSSNNTPPPNIYPVEASPDDDPIMTPDMYPSNACLEMAVSSIISLDSPSPPCSPIIFEPAPIIPDQAPQSEQEDNTPQEQSEEEEDEEDDDNFDSPTHESPNADSPPNSSIIPLEEDSAILPGTPIEKMPTEPEPEEISLATSNSSSEEPMIVPTLDSAEEFDDKQ